MVIDITNGNIEVRFANVHEALDTIKALSDLVSRHAAGSLTPMAAMTPRNACAVENRAVVPKHSPGTVRYQIGG